MPRFRVISATTLLLLVLVEVISGENALTRETQEMIIIRLAVQDSSIGHIVDFSNIREHCRAVGDTCDLSEEKNTTTKTLGVILSLSLSCLLRKVTCVSDSSTVLSDVAEIN